jgi:hypothetical protein
MFNNEYIAKKMHEDRQRELRGNTRNTIVEVVTEYAEEQREDARQTERRENRG